MNLNTSNMKRVQFSEQFYKHLHDAIMGNAGNVEYDSEAHGYPDTFYVDGYKVDATVFYGWELHDDSFDHAFGTWHDPHPYMEVEYLDNIDNVVVYEEETGEMVEGFDNDAFMSQFEEPFCLVHHHDKERRCYRHVKVNSGDKVLYFCQEATFLSYNKENGKLKVRTERGTYYTELKNIKIIAA